MVEITLQLSDSDSDILNSFANLFKSTLEDITKNLGTETISSLVDLRNISMTLGNEEFGLQLNLLEDQGQITRGRTPSGLPSVGSAVSSTAVPTRTGTRSNALAANSEAAPTGTRQPGRLAGTRVSFANSDTNQIPRQQIIDSLDKMCNELDIYVQITPQGGWTSRESGTTNHPTGYAADIQIMQTGGGLLYPASSSELYGQAAAILKKNANAKGIRPGIGGYPRFLHYDESPWRQDRYPTNKYASWNSGWNVGSYLA